jgi:hypothetical protein
MRDKEINESVSSHFSGVLNTVTAEDIKYEGIEINTRIIDKILPCHQKWSMEKIENYNLNTRFDEQYKGEYTELDQKTEDKCQEEHAAKLINNLLLPKITKMVPV